MLRRVWVLMVAFVACGLVSADAPNPTAADEQTLAKAQVGSDGPALLNYFKSRMVGDAERARIDGLIRQLGDDAYAVRERASSDLIAAGLPAIGPLQKASTDPDVEVARRAQRCLKKIERVPSSSLSSAAARLLAQRGPAGAIEVLLTYLPSADDSIVADEVREALCVLAKKAASADPALVKSLDDADVQRRSAGAVALIRSGVPEAIQAARKAVKDGSVEVRLRALTALVANAKDRAAVPDLIALIDQVPSSQVWSVQELLERMAGDGAPKPPATPDPKKFRESWQEWWSREGAKVDLAKLDSEPQMLGLTLVIARNKPGAVGAAGMAAAGINSGSVFEIDPAKNVVWRVDGLSLPADAVVLGKDRVAISEQGNGRVTIRDFKGKELWGRNVPMVSSLQKVGPGNLFIVARNQLLEFDGENREVYNFQRGASDISAGMKLKNGQVVFMNFNGEITRLDEQKKVVQTFSTQPKTIVPIAGIDVLSNGNVVRTTPSGVSEVDGSGKQVWSANVARPFSVQRLPNGNTLAGGMTSIVEVDRSEKTVWEYKPADGSTPFRAHRR